MKSGERAKFLQWHSEQEGPFNMAEEVKQYCQMDVDLLRMGMVKFRDLFMETTTVDPLLVSSTLPSACNHVFRKNFLPKKSLAVIPEGGYRRSEKYSVIGVRWLKWMEQETGLHIRHAGNGDEVSVPVKGNTYRVDGYCEETKTIYEFNG